LIAYFLGNTYAKNCRNRTIYVKLEQVVKVGRFLRQCIMSASATQDGRRLMKAQTATNN